MQKPKFKDAVANMTFKEKKEYIWEYYKLHIITTVFIVFLAGYTVHEVSRNRDTYVNLVVTGGMATAENLESLTSHLNDALLTEEQQKTYRVLTQFIAHTVTDPNASFEHTQKLFILMAAAEIDLIVFDEPTFDNFYEEGSFLPLTDLNVNLDGLETIERDGEIVGILVDDFGLLSDIFWNEGWIMGVMGNSERLDAVEELLEYLIENQS